MGSTGTDLLTPTSDYDMLLVFGVLPAPLQIVTTWVDGLLTEVYCTTAAAIQRAMPDPAKWAPASEEEALIRWLRTGRVEFDRHGILERGQAMVEDAPVAAPADTTIAFAWWGVGYNVAQLTRYLATDHPVSQAVVSIQLLYSLFQVIAHGDLEQQKATG